MKIRTIIFAIIFLVAILAVCVTASLFVIRCTSKPKVTQYQQMDYKGAGLTPASYFEKEDKMDITNPPSEVPYIREINGALCYCKKLESGGWDMQTTSSIQVAHGLGTNYRNIVGISGFVRNNTNNQFIPISCSGTVNGVTTSDAAVTQWNSTHIFLSRPAASFFNSISYNGTAISRVVLFVWFYV